MRGIWLKYRRYKAVPPDQPARRPRTVEVTGQINAVSSVPIWPRTPGVVYVTSQGLYYDTFVVKDPLPMEGKFQTLTNGQTEFDLASQGISADAGG